LGHSWKAGRELTHTPRRTRPHSKSTLASGWLLTVTRALKTYVAVGVSLSCTSKVRWTGVWRGREETRAVYSCVGLWGLVSVLICFRAPIRRPHTPYPPSRRARPGSSAHCLYAGHTSIQANCVDPVALKLNSGHVWQSPCPPSHAQDLVSRSTEKPPQREPGG
jgi:hypothetical protein